MHPRWCKYCVINIVPPVGASPNVYGQKNWCGVSAKKIIDMC
jgi:hypothetical protein